MSGVRHTLRLTVAAAAGFVLFCGAAMASGSVRCDGVQASIPYLETAGWEAFWGARNRPSELNAYNHTHERIFFIYRTTSTADWTEIEPNGSRTFHFPNEDEVVSVRCWATASGGPPTMQRVPYVPRPVQDPDVDPAFGGVTVDPDPQGGGGNLDPNLAGQILSIL